MTHDRPHERYEILLVKAVDGLLSAAERQELDGHLQACATCRAELEDFHQIKETTDMISQRILEEAKIEPPRPTRAARRWLYTGFILVFAGILLLIGWALASLFLDPEVPSIIKVGSGLAGLGALMLFAWVAFIHIRGKRHDPYTEIDQ
ncbi:MAG: zf-HC2 domain-containing protein [Bradymonadales bacterium]|nr:zf-HC2 domain-containing protein [Bradymonadales bacterium]